MPNWKSYVGGHLPSLGLAPEREAEITEELANQLEGAYSDALAGGASEDEARQQAEAQVPDWREFSRKISEAERPMTRLIGNRWSESRQVKTSSRARPGNAFWQDIKFSVRILTKNPGFAAVAVILLALGIGANTAIFSVVSGVLMQPLPYEEPDRLAMVWEIDQRSGIFNDRYRVTPGNYGDWKTQATSFDSLAAFDSMPMTVGVKEPERVVTGIVTANFLTTLGAQPLIGRLFSDGSEEVSNGPVAVMSHRLWQRRFAGNPDILNTGTVVNDSNVAVVGVLPPDFFFFSEEIQLWVMFPVPRNQAQNRHSHVLRVVGRLKPGVKFEKAQSEMDAIAGRLREEYPGDMTGFGVNVLPLHDQVVGGVRPMLLVLFGGVGLVLLVAAVNLANLLLNRAASRQQEMAVRAALGGGRMRLVRQSLTESLILSLIGGGFGLAVGYAATRALIAMAPGGVPRIGEVDMDGTVLLFALVLSVVTTVLFGLAPALQLSRTDLQNSLKAGGRAAFGSRTSGRLRGALVVCQTAVALVLLIGAGLLTQTFIQLDQTDPGISPQQLITLNVSLTGEEYRKRIQAVTFFRQLVENLERTHGIESAGATGFLPFRMGSGASIVIEGRTPPVAGQKWDFPLEPVTPEYFNTMGTRFVRGRGFEEKDDGDAAPVMVINQTLARRLWSNDEPLGSRVKVISLGEKAQWIEIVGVVGDIRRDGLDREAPPTMYVPHAQQPFPGYSQQMAVVVRATPSSMGSASRALRGAVLELDSSVALPLVERMDDVIAGSVSRQRFAMILIDAFAGLALLLAVVGIYGAVSYGVSQRTREVGLRIALGAKPGDVVLKIVGQGMVPAVAGVGVGIVIALVISRVLSSLLFNVAPRDPVTYAFTALLLVLAAGVSCYLPARRASSVDPVDALRYE